MSALEQWKAFQTVVDSGGYANAAAQLNRSQSSVSYAVQMLQQRLGVTLLEINGRKAKLTDKGIALLDRSRNLTHHANELDAFAKQLSQGWEAEIHLYSDTAFPTKTLMNALKYFETHNRGARVELHEAVLSGANEAIERGEADIAISHRVPKDSLAEPLLDMKFIAVAHHEHRLHHLDHEISSVDLERERQIVTRDSGLHEAEDIGWLDASHRWTVGSLRAAYDAVSAGLGYAWLPEHDISAALDAHLLKPLPLKLGGIYRASLSLVIARAAEQNPGAQALATFIKQAVKERHS